MLTITTHTGTDMPPDLAAKCAGVLCRIGSDMQGYFLDMADGRYEDCDLNMKIAVATKIVDDEIVPIGWACLHQWNGAPSLQCFVFPQHRSRGLGSALAAALTATNEIPLNYVAVFSDSCIGMAKRCGFREVAHYKRVDDGWIKSSEQ